MKMTRCRFLIVFVTGLAGLVLLSGCSMKSMALRSTVDLMEKGSEAFYEESDVRFARESMAGQLKFLEILLKNDPANEKLLLYSARGFGAYAFLFIEDEDPERAKVFYARGRDYGLRQLSKRMSGGTSEAPDLESFRKDLDRLEKKDVPVLFWTAYCWGGLSNLSRDNPQALADLPKVESMMKRVNELSPGYFYGGADIFMGSYYGSRPKMLGGSLEKSKFHFDRAVKESDGKFVMAQVLYALHYGTASQDKGLFKSLLEEALAAPLESFPEQRLSNTIAKERATKLLEDINERF